MSNAYMDTAVRLRENNESLLADLFEYKAKSLMEQAKSTSCCHLIKVSTDWRMDDQGRKVVTSEVFIDTTGRNVWVTDTKNKTPLCIAIFDRSSKDGDGGAARAIATAEEFWKNSAS